MTTIRQLIQTSPTRANELLARLVDTSDSAVKTRDRLFTDLKEELELLTELEEKHLFPVLRKHKQTKDLVAEAIDDNKQMRKLLAELDRTPRDSEEFGEKATELRTVFQQHVRDEKKELLPAVLKALSDEEAQAIVESIEDRKAEIEEEKRAEAEERRAAAREEREQAEAVQQAAETAVAALWTGPLTVRRSTERAQDAAQTGLGVVTEAAQRTSEQAIQVLSRSGERAQVIARESTQTLTVMAEAGSLLTRSFQDFSREWLSLMQESVQTNIEGLTELARCRSVPDLMAVQNGLMRAQLQQTVEGARRIAEVTSRAAAAAQVSAEGTRGRAA